MADKTKITLIVGVVLLAVSFLCAAGILYSMGNTNRANQQKLASLEARLANLMLEKAESRMAPKDFLRVKREPINAGDLLSRAEGIYGKQELSRKDGVLWIDRKASSVMINLGAVNGLKSGSRLSVYEGDAKVGDITVVAAMDLVSYVKPVSKTLEDFKNNYYRVVANKETP